MFRTCLSLATLLIVSCSFPAGAAARSASGVLFGDTLVTPEGDRFADVLWVNCEGASDALAQLKCEMGDADALRERLQQPVRCFVGEVEPPAPGGFFLRSEETLLVKRTDVMEPFVGEDGRRNCSLANEQTYLGLHSWAFEHSGFVPAAGERWWLDAVSFPSSTFEADSIEVDSMRFVCVELRGVAMPEREFGYGHMGAYNRLLFVTEVLRTYAPNRHVIESGAWVADQRACDR
jgi:hypothetical protein